MNTELVTSTYSQIAAGIVASANQILFLSRERERILNEYKEADVPEGSFLEFIGGKLINELTNAIDSVRACSQAEHDLMERKLSEPVELQLGLNFRGAV
jgi:hypothetical protein